MKALKWFLLFAAVGFLLFQLFLPQGFLFCSWLVTVAIDLINARWDKVAVMRQEPLVSAVDLAARQVLERNVSAIIIAGTGCLLAVPLWGLWKIFQLTLYLGKRFIN